MDDQQLQVLDRRVVRPRLALFLRLQAQRAALLAAARSIVPQIASMRTEIAEYMRLGCVDVLDYTEPLHAEVRRIERRVKRRATVDDVFAIVAQECGDATCQAIQSKLKALLEQSVDVKRDLRVSFKRGAQYERERHHAVVNSYTPPDECE